MKHLINSFKNLQAIQQLQDGDEVELRFLSRVLCFVYRANSIKSPHAAIVIKPDFVKIEESGRLEYVKTYKPTE